MVSYGLNRNPWCFVEYIHNLDSHWGICILGGAQSDQPRFCHRARHYDDCGCSWHSHQHLVSWYSSETLLEKLTIFWFPLSSIAIFVFDWHLLFVFSMGLALHGACASSHGHSHHHNHHHSADESNRNINIRAAVIHVVGDLVQSVGVFISSIVIKFYVRKFHGLKK